MGAQHLTGLCKMYKEWNGVYCLINAVEQKVAANWIPNTIKQKEESEVEGKC